VEAIQAVSMERYWIALQSLASFFVMAGLDPAKQQPG
jgi:hypothetical protein